VSALLPFTNRPEQPRVPPSCQPPLMGIWLIDQPTEQPRLLAPASLLEEIDWQRLNRDGRSDSTLKGLDEAYVIDQRSKVAAFIERNRLRGLLLLARGPLNAAFGESTMKLLALVRDHEGSTTLYCLILVRGDMHEARLALRSFDEHWWLAHFHQASGKLNFDFELV